MSHDIDAHTLAVPYALHALPDDEAAQFEEHLWLCSSCRDEVDEVREVAARLGAAESITTPVELRRRVLSEIAEVRPLPPVISEGEPAPAVRHDGARRWWPRIATGVAAALLVVVGVMTSVLVDQSRELDDSSDLRAEIGRVAGAPDMQQASGKVDGARVIALSSRTQNTTVLFSTGMEAPPDGKDYQAWFIDGDRMRSAGVIDEDDDGVRPLVAAGLDDAAQLGITVEPDGGSEQPTTNPLVVMDLES
ncbi:anti-sigma factor [Solicola gregarius]|uniref:Regulator of SigK n=1 Tax=Solicola gregarius TaxID=2908642 RepID=A0AA46YKL8_9ACTN|nr:anti-sigma factor [Solicola gregarius]UYM04616.1 anti-sigma factor [Solicola gregarius]